MTKSKVIRWMGAAAIWLVVLLVALCFGTQGYAKFSNQSYWARAFAHWGYPVWFRILIGIAECVAAIFVLIPRLAVYGSSLIFSIMLGGIVTHVRAGEARMMKAEILWSLLALIIFLARRKNALDIRSWLKSAGPRLSGREQT